jgi:hypothetical protein
MSELPPAEHITAFLDVLELVAVKLGILVLTVLGIAALIRRELRHLQEPENRRDRSDASQSRFRPR